LLIKVVYSSAALRLPSRALRSASGVQTQRMARRAGLRESAAVVAAGAALSAGGGKAPAVDVKPSQDADCSEDSRVEYPASPRCQGRPEDAEIVFSSADDQPVNASGAEPAELGAKKSARMRRAVSSVLACVCSGTGAVAVGSTSVGLRASWAFSAAEVIDVSAKFGVVALASALTLRAGLAVWQLAGQQLRDRREPEGAALQEAVAETALEQQTRHLPLLRDPQQVVRQHIQEEILTLRCPHCRAAFDTFDEWLVCRCRGCGREFCGLCLRGFPDTVLHVRECPERPAHMMRGALWMSVPEFDAFHKQRMDRMRLHFLREVMLGGLAELAPAI